MTPPAAWSARWRRRLLLTALSGLALGVALSLAPAAVAAPLGETEPNDSVLNANGPIPADGFLNTAAVADDEDHFLLRLQGRRQITMTVRRVSGCSTVGGNRMTLVARDGGQLVSISSFTSTTEPFVKTWTTPRDATEYIGRLGIGSFRGIGCQTLVTVSPAEALITGPLPVTDYGRTLQASAPPVVGRNAPVAVTASGVAADEDRVAAQWRTGGCPAAPDGDISGLVQSNLLAAGAFSVALPTTSPSVRGPATLCTWLVDSLGKLSPLLRQETVQVDPPPPSGSIRQKAVLFGRAIGARVSNATGSVEFRFARRGRIVARRTGVITNGRAVVSTAGLKPGRYRVSLWLGDRRLSARSLRIKPIPTRTLLRAPRAVRPGKPAVLVGRVRSALGKPRGRCRVQTRAMTRRATWSNRSSRRLSARGTCKLRVRLTATSRVRVTFVGTPGWKSSRSAQRLIRVRR